MSRSHDYFQTKQSLFVFIMIRKKKITINHSKEQHDDVSHKMLNIDLRDAMLMM